MGSLALYFQGRSSPQLERTIFLRSAQSEPLTTSRGKTPGATRSTGTFQWSPAVRGLALTLVKYKLSSFPDSKAVNCLGGERGSTAASLDYAITKLPGWLLDMFGVEASGSSLARRIFKRTNPERKRPGPVLIAVNEVFLPPSEVRIYLEGKECLAAESLQSLVSYLACDEQVEFEAAAHISSHNLRMQVEEKTSYPPEMIGQIVEPYTLQGFIADSLPVMSGEFEAKLKRAYDFEVTQSLLQTDIFHKSSLEELISRARRHPKFLKVAGKNPSLVNEIELSLSDSERLGLNLRKLKSPFDENKFKVASIPFHTASTAIWIHLQQRAEFSSMELIQRWTSSTFLAMDVVEGRLEADIKAMALNLGAAGYLLGKQKQHPFRPFMLMPMFSHRVLRPPVRSKATAKHNEYHFMYDIPSSSTFYFESLKNAGQVSRGSKTQETNLVNVGALLRDGDDSVRAIAPFPLFHMYPDLFDAQVVDENQIEFQRGHTVLFLHESIIADREKALYLNQAVRDAWLELINSLSARAKVVTQMLGDPFHFKYMFRIADPIIQYL